MNVSKNVTYSRSFTHDHTYFRLVTHTDQFCISRCQLLILFIQLPNQRTELHILSLQHPNFLIAALWILGKKLHIPSQFGTICEHLFTTCIVLTNILMPHLKVPSQNIDKKPSTITVHRNIIYRNISIQPCSYHFSRFLPQ